MKDKKFKEKLELGIGKLRRFSQTTWRKELLDRSLKQRSGECVRCGACCELAFECVFLKKSAGKTTCLIHMFKPDNCKFFPITHKDICDRDKVLPERSCGYQFLAPAGKVHKPGK
jgi:hypothetical protein